MRGLGEIATTVVDESGRRSIVIWLDQATNIDPETTLDALCQADTVRGRMGLTWVQVVRVERAAA